MCRPADEAIKAQLTWLLHCSLVVVERLRLRQLRWGDAMHVNAVLQKSGHVDIAVGADVVYVEEAVPALFDSIARLLDPSREVGSVLLWLPLRLLRCMHCCLTSARK